MKKIALRYALGHPKRTVFIAFLITIIIGSGSQFIFMDDDIMNMLPKDLKSRQVWNEIVDEFKYSDFLFVAFGGNDEDVLSAENLATSWDLTKAFEEIDQIDEVLSLSNINRIENVDNFLEVDKLISRRNLTEKERKNISKYLKDNPNISAQMIGKNNDYINIIIRPKKDASFSMLVASIQEITAPYEKNHDFHLGGQPYIAGKVPGLIKAETQKLMLIGLLIMSIILLSNLRSLSAVVMIISVIIFSMLSMIGVLGWIYHFTGSPHYFFTFVNSSMPIVLLTIANSDGVHVLSRFFRETRMHKDVRKSLTHTMDQLFLPIFLTSITTATAFLIMLTSPVAAMTGYGVSIGFGILWAWILSSTYLPAIIYLKKWNFSKSALSKPSFLEKIIHVFGQNILKRPKMILLIGSFILLISSIGIQYINVEVNLINLFKKGNTIRESTKFLDQEMAGSMNLMMKINGDLKDPDLLNQIVKIQNYLESVPTVNTTVSIADIIEGMHKIIMDNDPTYKIIPNTRKKVNNLFTMYSISGDPDDFESLVNYEYNTGLITAMMHTVSTKDVVQIADDIEEFLSTETADLNIEVSGLMMFLKDFVDLIVQSSITSIFFSIVIIFFIVWIFFHSWRFGILSILPLSSAVILNFGLMGWFGIDLTHFTALLTSIIIGVGIDFAIHYITEFRNYSLNNTSNELLSQNVVDNVGYPILLDVFSNMGFGALIFSSLIPLVHMGGLMVFAMISTSFGTLTILAAVMEIQKHNLLKRGNT